jgi:methylmalonyl-CoA mutase cobalamin-binding subunit
LREAGDAAMGATLYILGHDHACDDCIEACRKAGIKAIKLLAAVDILWVNEESL